MGACDVVPGVSGGTVAFVTGIYEKLVSSLTSFKPKLIKQLREEGPSSVWKEINGSFLLSLGLGVAISILTFAKLITSLLEKYPPVIWSLFFSLVLASSFVMLRKVSAWNPSKAVTLILGTLFGYAITVLSPSSGNDSMIFVFFSGFIAICAMILPGISGSFILLLLGQYLFIINSLLSFNLLVIITFSLGCLSGLLCFSHFLKWLFSHYYHGTLCFLTGIMFGSLNKLWPWKKALSFVTNRHGEKIPALQENILPHHYEKVLSLDPMTSISLITMFVGFFIVIVFNQLGNQKTQG